MKLLLISLLTLIPSFAAADEANEKGTVTVNFRVIELCDSGFCDAVECDFTITDEFGSSTTKFYYLGQDSYPRVCSQLEDGQQVTLKYMEDKDGTGICEQVMDASDVEVLDLKKSDCFGAN